MTIRNHGIINSGALTTFLIKRLNVWTNADERWQDPDDWRRGNMAGQRHHASRPLHGSGKSSRGAWRKDGTVFR